MPKLDLDAVDGVLLAITELAVRPNYDVPRPTELVPDRVTRLERRRLVVVEDQVEVGVPVRLASGPRPTEQDRSRLRVLETDRRDPFGEPAQMGSRIRQLAAASSTRSGMSKFA